MSGDTVARAEQPAEEHGGIRFEALRRVAPADIGLRFAFGALVSMVAAIIGHVTTPIVGGLFLGFPAILPATVTLLEKRDGEAQAVSDVRGAVFGAAAMIVFAVVAAALLIRSAWVALLLALLAWVVVSGLLYVAVRALLRGLGEKQYLPEIPTSDAAAVIETLAHRRLTLALAESCTGGLVASLLSSVPGASHVLRGGLVVYTDDAKRDLLAVDAELIRAQSAVSVEVARAMARGVRARLHSDLGAAVTGMAGGGDERHPAGTAHLAVAIRDDRCVTRTLSGDRGPGRNQERQVRELLALIRAVAREPMPGPE